MADILFGFNIALCNKPGSSLIYNVLICFIPALHDKPTYMPDIYYVNNHDDT